MTVVPVSDGIICAVERMAVRDGIETLKILNRNKRLLNPDVWFAGVGPQNAENSGSESEDEDNDDYSEPSIPSVRDKEQQEDNKEAFDLLFDDVDEDERADLLNEDRNNFKNLAYRDAYDVPEPEQDEDDDPPIMDNEVIGPPEHPSNIEDDDDELPPLAPRHSARLQAIRNPITSAHYYGLKILKLTALKGLSHKVPNHRIGWAILHSQVAFFHLICDKEITNI